MIKRISARFTELQSNTAFQYLLLVIITLAAAALRFYKLGEWSFWIEEHHSLRHALELVFSAKIFTYTHPLFYVLIKPVLAFLGVNEWTARLLPTLIGIATVPLLFWITRKLFGFPVALLAATLLAVAPWHIYWSQNSRFYTLVLLLSTLSLFSFYWGLEKDDFRYIAASLVTVVLAGASHALAVLLLPMFIIYFLLLKVLPFEKPAGLRWRNLLPFLLLPLVGYAGFNAIRVFQAGETSLTTMLYSKFFDKSTASFIGYDSPYAMLTAVVYYIGTPLAFLTIPGSFFLLTKKKRIGLLLILGSWGVLAAIMLLTLFASTASRYVFMSLPCWVILGAVAVKELYDRARTQTGFVVWIFGILLLLLRDPVVEDVLYYAGGQESAVRLIVVGAAVCLLGLLLLARSGHPLKYSGVTVWGLGIFLIILVHPATANTLYYTYQHGHRDNWKAASATITERKQQGDVVVSSITPVAQYYLREEAQHIKFVDLNKVMLNGHRVWFVEDFGVGQLMGTTFETWAAANCNLVADWDHWVAGRNWKMRVHLCEPDTLQNSLVTK